MNKDSDILTIRFKEGNAECTSEKFYKSLTMKTVFIQCISMHLCMLHINARTHAHTDTHTYMTMYNNYMKKQFTLYDIHINSSMHCSVLDYVWMLWEHHISYVSVSVNSTSYHMWSSWHSYNYTLISFYNKLL